MLSTLQKLTIGLMEYANYLFMQSTARPSPSHPTRARPSPSHPAPPHPGPTCGGGAVPPLEINNLIASVRNRLHDQKLTSYRFRTQAMLHTILSGTVSTITNFTIYKPRIQVQNPAGRPDNARVSNFPLPNSCKMNYAYENVQNPEGGRSDGRPGLTGECSIVLSGS